MSRSAGTLITTNNATYIPPRFMPGYQGHVPTMKFDYAETYGNASAKYFQDYRSQTLNNSKSNYAQGGYFPSYYSHQPELVMGNRTRNRDRWLNAPRYQLTNLDYDRKEELIKFDKMTQGHRDHYNDKSGTAHRVDYFVLPNKAEDQFKLTKPHLILSASYPSNISLASEGKISARSSVRHSLKPVSSQRDREMRDVYYESR